MIRRPYVCHKFMIFFLCITSLHCCVTDQGHTCAHLRQLFIYPLHIHYTSIFLHLSPPPPPPGVQLFHTSGGIPSGCRGIPHPLELSYVQALLLPFWGHPSEHRQGPVVHGRQSGCMLPPPLPPTCHTPISLCVTPTMHRLTTPAQRGTIGQEMWRLATRMFG